MYTEIILIIIKTPLYLNKKYYILNHNRQTHVRPIVNMIYSQRLTQHKYKYIIIKKRC